MFFLFCNKYPNIMMSAGVIFTFALTIIGMLVFKDKLPADEGRDFAVDGKLSKGKPRGAGIIFITAFTVGTLLFCPLKVETLIYVGLVILEMLTGYLDDRAKKPWGRLKKGLMDLGVALVLAFTYVHYNGCEVFFGALGISINIPVWLMFILIVILVWACINVTNCADGIDGLSGTLVIVTTLSFYIADLKFEKFYRFTYFIMFFLVSIIAYLWFNAGPSILMMGDAGSRAMGLFISIVALKSGCPFLIIPFAIVLILDGGLGLFKVTMIKLTKNKDFMNKIRTPLHDHVRKKMEPSWANGQVVMRFAIIQAVISIITVFLIMR